MASLILAQDERWRRA